jgi:hypothetical protein
MTTWITEKNGKVGRVRQTAGEQSPGPVWTRVSDDWGGNQGDDLAWFDAAMRRMPDAILVSEGKRTDNRGQWYHKHNTGETRLIYNLDEAPGPDWTREPLLPDEPYQKWDDDESRWIVDTVKKAQAQKEQRIAEKKSAIQDAEQRIQRSLIAKQAGTATEEDKQYFTQITAEIIALREELRELQR